MDGRYLGVICRTLKGDEQRVQVDESQTPLVIEPLHSPDMSFFGQFLKDNSTKIVEDIAAFGAVLFRGFAVNSAREFERCIVGIQGLHPMREMLFSEPGRTIVEGTDCVFYTNKLMKTGGRLQFGIFHTENYASPDVPHYVSFWCETPCEMGGETGLVNMAKVYADLPDPLKGRLTSSACLVGLYPLRQMSERYGVPTDCVHEFCKNAGLSIGWLHGQEHVVVYKPSVVQHPITGERALLVNLLFAASTETPIVRAFLKDYAGSEWLMHRLLWRAAWLRPIVERLTIRRALVQDAMYITAGPAPLGGARALSEMFSKAECAQLGPIMRRRYSSFLWKRGDVLIVDNLKMAHNGMAGRGERKLRSILCNSVPLSFASDSPGLQTVANGGDHEESLGDRIIGLRAAAGTARSMG